MQYIIELSHKLSVLREPRILRNISSATDTSHYLVTNVSVGLQERLQNGKLSVTLPISLSCYNSQYCQSYQIRVFVHVV
jgi:hypothetical protein